MSAEDAQAAEKVALTDAERESLAQAVVRDFIDHPRHNPAHGLGVFDRSRCDRIVAPAVEHIATERVAKALREAAERSVRWDDEVSENDAAGLYMQIRFGGDTGKPEDWSEAYRIARLDDRADRMTS